MNRGFLAHWLTTGAALSATAWLLPGVHIDSLGALALAARARGFVNAIVRPLLGILTLPFTVVTLGLFYFIVNGVAFGLAAALVPGFQVTSFFSAILGALMVGFVSWFIGAFKNQRPERKPRSVVVDVHRQGDGRWGT